MKNASKFYIDGEWVDPTTDDQLDVINPATEAVVGQVAMGGTADVDRAVAAPGDQQVDRADAALLAGVNVARDHLGAVEQPVAANRASSERHRKA